MSENDNAQAAMDRLFGVSEPRINIERPPGYDGDVKLGRNAFYSRALVEARALFPNDEVAQHRFAERAAVMRVNASRASSRHSQQILVDVAFIEIFSEVSGGAGGRLVAIETFPDRIIARGVDGKLVKVPYAVGIDGVTFGAPQMIENLADEQEQ